MFATGRVFQPYDMPAVRTIVRDTVRQEHRCSAYVIGVVTSTPFRMRRADALTGDAEVGP